MNHTKITHNVALEIGSHESILLQAYLDSVGVWTWSVGLTSATGHNAERYVDNPSTLEHALAIYIWALGNYADAVRKVFRGFELSEAQFAAALSFHWNTGRIKSASWVKKWKKGDMIGARKSFMEWRKPPEIEGRRRKEARLLFEGKWSNDGTITLLEVHANHKPNWSSAKKINIKQPLASLLGAGAQIPPSPDHLIRPKAITKAQKDTHTSLIESITSIVGVLFRKW